MVRKMHLKREKKIQYQVEENFESKDRDKNEKPSKNKSM